MTNFKNSNFRLVNALLRQPVDRTPVWMMRQAGRYLPEYRRVRERAGSFMNLCQNPELASQVTLQPLERFDLDGAIIFSDILTIPAAMGLGLYFVKGEGPCFEHPIRDERAISQLPIPDPQQDLHYVPETVRLTKQALHNSKPVIGFSGSPWTLACYMIEGGSSKTFSHIKGLLYQNPQALYALLQKLATAVTHYLNAQIEAGADTVMIFDTWGGVLTPSHYEQFSLAYMKQIIAGLIKSRDQRTIPNILFTKNGGQNLSKMAQTGCNAISLDWTINIGEARQQVGDQVALQGNLDPCALYGAPTRIEQEVKNVLQDFGPYSGHVFNLGHGVYPDIDPEHVQTLISAVRRYGNNGSEH